MDFDNPYAPPQAALEGAAMSSTDQRPWRLEGNTLIVRKDATLPPLCLYSGEQVQHGEERRSLSWTPVWFRLMWGFATLIAVLAHSAVRRTATIELTLGPTARKRRARGNLVGILGVSLAIAMFVLGAADDLPALILLAFPVLIAALILAAAAQPFRVVKIDRTEIRLKLRPPAVQAFALLQAR